jgi:hypothetical protein
MAHISSFRLITQIPDSRHSGGYELVISFNGLEYLLSDDFDAGSSLANDITIPQIDIDGFEALLRGAKIYSNYLNNGKPDTWRCSRVNISGWTSDGRGFCSAINVDPKQDRNADQPGDNDHPVILAGLSPFEWGWATWMNDNLGMLGKKTLGQICIPGAHDAGMSAFNKAKGPLVSRANTITQTQPFYDLLTLGVRFFDLRPVINEDGSFSTGHYSKTLVGTVGANGISFEEVVRDINRFTSLTKELIVLSLSHYRSPWGLTFDNDALSKLISQLQQINGLYAVPDATNLQDITISSYLCSGAAVLVLLSKVDDDLELPSPLPSGFYSQMDRFPMIDSFADTSDLEKMMTDQFQKLEESNDKYFLISWTLTCPALGSPSILDLADQANAKLDEILKHCRKGLYPKIVYLDEIQSSVPTAIALQINQTFS